MPATSGQAGNLWMAFAFISVFFWGLYGVLLHTGQVAMNDPQGGRYKAFLWVGIAYVLVAVLGPIVMLALGGGNWNMPAKGIVWSLVAGTAGAVGAFGVLLAFGAKGSPAVVMSIIFAGAPIVNAVIAISLHPPAGGFSALRWQFLVGILLAALGGMMVTLYKPAPGGAAPQPAKAAPAEE